MAYPKADVHELPISKAAVGEGPTGGTLPNYELHLARLEKALGAQEPPVVMVAVLDFVDFPPEPIAGWRDHNGFQCQRRPVESDEDLAERAQA